MPWGGKGSGKGGGKGKGKGGAASYSGGDYGKGKGKGGAANYYENHGGERWNTWVSEEGASARIQKEIKELKQMVDYKRWDLRHALVCALCVLLFFHLCRWVFWKLFAGKGQKMLHVTPQIPATPTDHVGEEGEKKLGKRTRCKKRFDPTPVWNRGDPEPSPLEENSWTEPRQVTMFPHGRLPNISGLKTFKSVGLSMPG